MKNMNNKMLLEEHLKKIETNKKVKEIFASLGY